MEVDTPAVRQQGTTVCDLAEHLREIRDRWDRQTNPPGDPAELLFLSDSFATAGNDIAPLVADVRTIAVSNLPEIWKGDGGAAAARVVSATADLMGTAQPAFAKAATALTDYAGKVRR